MPQIITFLDDQVAIEEPDKHPRTSVQAKINLDPNGIELQFDGYGTREEEDGYGTPVFIEFYDGRLRVITWNDINQSDPQIIDMELARTDNRKED
jgi:hypothetical protein